MTNKHISPPCGHVVLLNKCVTWGAGIGPRRKQTTNVDSVWLPPRLLLRWTLIRGEGSDSVLYPQVPPPRVWRGWPEKPLVGAERLWFQSCHREGVRKGRAQPWPARAARTGTVRSKWAHRAGGGREAPRRGPDCTPTPGPAEWYSARGKEMPLMATRLPLEAVRPRGKSDRGHTPCDFARAWHLNKNALTDTKSTRGRRRWGLGDGGSATGPKVPTLRYRTETVLRSRGTARRPYLMLLQRKFLTD